MGMASVSWFYLFNIQVRANCTTACNIQAALQYVELTHVSSSASFFLYLFSFYKKKCACSLEQVPKSCWPRPFPGGRSLWAEMEDEHWCWCPDRSVWLVTFTFTEMHKENCERFFFFCLFVCFPKIYTKKWTEPVTGIVSFCLFLTTCFFQKVKLFVVKKVKLLCLCVNFKIM